MIIDNIYSLIEEVKWEALSGENRRRRIANVKLPAGKTLARTLVAAFAGKKKTKQWWGDKNAEDDTHARQETTTQKFKRHAKSVAHTLADNVVSDATTPIISHIVKAVDMGVSDATDTAKEEHNIERLTKMQQDNNKRNAGGQVYRKNLDGTTAADQPDSRIGKPRNKQSKATSLSRFQFIANKRREILDEHPN